MKESPEGSDRTAGSPDRRDLLRGAGGLVALELLGLACARPEPALKPDQVAIPLSDLPVGKRLTVIVAGNPVEVTREGAAVTARLLRCTHWGCAVRWREAERAYVCPCHEGRYDENGNVLSGPPPLPLRTVPAAVSKDRLIVG